MKRKLKATLVILLSISVIVCFSSCGRSGSKDETFKIGSSTTVDTLNPLASYEQSSYEIFQLVYDPLVRYDENLEAKPALATKWERSKDNLTWTFYLNKDAKWHDGKNVTSADVKWTYDTMLKTGLGSMYVSYLEGIKKVTCVDDYTVKVTTSKPKANMLMNTTPILPKHIWSKIKTSKLEDYKNAKVIGSGPYKFVSSKDGAVTVTRNDEYYGDTGAVKNYVFVEYKNTDSLAQALKVGEIDAAVNLSSSQYSQLKKNDDLTVVSGQINGFMQVGINCWTSSKSKGNPLLKDKNVRKAIEYAIDKTKIIDVAYGGQGTEGTTLLNEGDTYHYTPSDSELRSYNISKAKALLDKSGYKDTDNDGIREDSSGNKLSFKFINIGDNADEVKTGQIIKATCKKAGIEIDLKTKDSGALQDDIDSGDYDMFMWGWGGDYDPTTILGLLTTAQIGGNNEPHWSNSTYDSLYAKQMTQMNEKTRIATVCEMQKIAYDDAPYIILLYDNNIQAYNSKNWEGLKQVPSKGTYYFNMTIVNYMNVTPK